MNDVRFIDGDVGERLAQATTRICRLIAGGMPEAPVRAGVELVVQSLASDRTLLVPVGGMQRKRGPDGSTRLDGPSGSARSSRSSRSDGTARSGRCARASRSSWRTG